MNMHENHGYSVPTYQAPDADWYHFLHGNVPGHQIDFIYRADVPQGPLTRQHFSHLARLMKYIEPRHGSPQAFAIGNLSRDDTQYEPGHGGIALIFGLRVKGAVDHAGRQDPPFCHAVACVDRQFDTQSIHAAATRFHEQLLEQPNAPTDGCRWYQSYVAMAQQSSWAILNEMQAYIRAFTTIPALRPSSLGLRWTVEGSSAPKRVVIVYPEQSPFSMVAYHMARIASVLVESDLRWTAISTGREQDLMGGTSVRFVSEREAVQEADDVVLMHINQIPSEPAEIARLLFGAQEVRLSQTPDFRLKWRHMGEHAGAPMPASPDSAKTRPWVKPEESEKHPEIEPAAESSDGLSRPHHEPEPVRKRWRALAPAFFAAGVLIFALLLGLGFAATRAPEVRNPNDVGKARLAAPAESTQSIESVSPQPEEEMVQPGKTVASAEPTTAPSAEPSVSASASASTEGTSKKRVRPGKTKPGKGSEGVKSKGGSVLNAELGGKAGK
jgi:hypothetical protein